MQLLQTILNVLLVIAGIEYVVGQCPPDAPVAMCLDDPCKHSVCPGDKDAVCKPNFCGGCNAVYYNRNNEIADCSISVKNGTCPEPRMLSSCPLGTSLNCLLDIQCEGMKKCCSNGCTLVCMVPIEKSEAPKEEKVLSDAAPVKETPAKSPTKSTATEGVCANEEDHECAVYNLHKDFYCSHPWTKKYCKKMCGLCQCKGCDKDDDNHCNPLAADKDLYCESDVWTSTNCKHMCGYCTIGYKPEVTTDLTAVIC